MQAPRVAGDVGRSGSWLSVELLGIVSSAPGRRRRPPRPPTSAVGAMRNIRTIARAYSATNPLSSSVRCFATSRSCLRAFQGKRIAPLLP